jgi:N-acetylglutamate synthase-like GNAT family acetyltransferase
MPYFFNSLLQKIKGGILNLEFLIATKHDAEKLIEVQNRAFYDDFLVYGECPAYQESLEGIENHIASKIVYKMLDNNEIIGDMIITRLDAGHYYLRVISIIPEYQGKKIGQKAMKFLEKEITDAKEWDLITPFKSFRNHHFYEKMGYKKIDEYRQSDLLIMYRYKKTIQ